VKKKRDKKERKGKERKGKGREDKRDLKKSLTTQATKNV
jgi:hypothetical protein